MTHHHHPHGTNFCHQTLNNNPSHYSSCCCSCNCNSHFSSHQPPPISTDHLFQLLKTQSFLKPKQPHSQNHLQDLLRRVAALETSLSQLSSRAPSDPPLSLRQAAARKIQTQFRRFLVRRSQTLRDLNCLALIKSRVAALRAVVCGDAGADAEGVSKDAMDLLLRLDSMQSSNAMIRDGKRSVSRQLMRMLEFVDKVLVRDVAPPVPRARSCKRVSFADKEDEEGFGRVLEDNEEVFEDGNGAFYGRNGGFELSAPQPVQMELSKSS